MHVPLLLNITQCHLKLSHWLKASASASAALALAPTNHKALYRRGAAATHLGHTAAAIGDLGLALELLGGGNAQIEAMLEQARSPEAAANAVRAKQVAAVALGQAL